LMSINIFMLEVIENYKSLKESIPEILDVSGYRNDFVAKRIGMTPAYFSVKKQRGNWSEAEVEKILDVVTKANEEVLDYLDAKFIASKKTNNTITSDEFEKQMGWK